MALELIPHLEQILLFFRGALNIERGKDGDPLISQSASMIFFFAYLFIELLKKFAYLLDWVQQIPVSELQIESICCEINEINVQRYHDMKQHQSLDLSNEMFCI